MEQQQQPRMLTAEEWYKSRTRAQPKLELLQGFASYPLVHGDQLEAILKQSTHFPNEMFYLFSVASWCPHCTKRTRLFDRLHHAGVPPFWFDVSLLDEDERTSLYRVLRAQGVDTPAFPTFYRIQNGRLLEAHTPELWIRRDTTNWTNEQDLVRVHPPLANEQHLFVSYPIHKRSIPILYQDQELAHAFLTQLARLSCSSSDLRSKSSSSSVSKVERLEKDHRLNSLLQNQNRGKKQEEEEDLLRKSEEEQEASPTLWKQEAAVFSDFF